MFRQTCEYLRNAKYGKGQKYLRIKPVKLVNSAEFPLVVKIEFKTTTYVVKVRNIELTWLIKVAFIPTLTRLVVLKNRQRDFMHYVKFR